MSDIFDEVNEEVRREQFQKLWEKHGTTILGVAVAIVIGVGGWRAYQWWDAQQAAAAGAAFEQAATLVEQAKNADAQAAFAKIAAEAPRGYRSLARLREAEALAAADRAGAVKAFDAIAADTNVAQIDRDLANVRAAALLVDTDGYEAIAQRVEPLAAAGQTFRHTARELLELAALRNNNTAAAKWIDAIVTDAETPQSLRGRAEALQALLPPAAKG